MTIENTKLGKNTIIREPVNIYGAEIGDKTKIGCFVEIQKGVKIGKNCKIEPYAFICTGVIIKDGVFVGPHVCFTNDKYPFAVNPNGTLKDGGDWNVVKTVVNKRASIGANSTIVCGVIIGEGALIGAGAVVTRDVPAFKKVYGNPAREPIVPEEFRG